MMQPRVLIVDEDEEFRERVVGLLQKRGYWILGVSNINEAIGTLTRDLDIDVILVGRQHSHGVNESLFDVLIRMDAPPEVILILTSREIHYAISAMKKGAFDDIYMPFEMSELEEKIQKARKTRQKKIRARKRKSLRKRIEDIFVAATLAEANVREVGKQNQKSQSTEENHGKD